jgi:DNA repair protein RadC
MNLKHLPADSRPREKLLQRGPAALSDAELLALLLRTGIQGKSVVVTGARAAGPVWRHGRVAAHLG